jgi:2',3'-cyclic-nucleotide 2'-phosphodiesterase (5'-nucleotidase family)
MRNFIYIIIIGAGLMACSSVNTLSFETGSVKMTKDLASDSRIDSLVSPYQDSLNEEMNEVIAQATVDFVVARPSSNLGNWVASAVFVNQTKTMRLSIPTFCLLNTGGIRASLNKGDITVGDMYKLMPFDNEIVWVKLPISVLPEIEAYLVKSGGEPLAGATMVNGKLEIGSWRKEATHVWVITSDYLMNGGDKMNFFQKKEDINSSGRLIRDALITEAKEQKILLEDTTVRIRL